MSRWIDPHLDRLGSIDLAELDRSASFLTRKDRKYIIDPSRLATVLALLPTGTRILEPDNGRWSTYQSTYYDTAALDSYLMAARRRPNRFKIRTRRYVDGDLTFAEVKTKDRLGRTVKHRQTLDSHSESTIADAVRDFGQRFDEIVAYASGLQPSLTNRYLRATLVLPGSTARVTIDADYRAVVVDGACTGLGEAFIVETKTNGKPSPVDRLLWQSGCRPVGFSKYATALAAVHAGLPSNRWHRVLTRHVSPHLCQRTPRHVATTRHDTDTTRQKQIG